ncbi:MAG: right-handed parallel beta-helix repeat-containing protein, partial [Clostridia bacterium]
RLSAARLPAEGYYTISSVRDADANAPKSEIFAQHRAVYVSASQIGDRLATLDRLQDIRIRIFHYWKDEVTTLAGYDAKTKRLALARPTTMTVSRGDRYYLENVREALSTPGQWYLDHETGKLFYVPFFGESMADTTLQIGYMEQMMILHGVSNLHFEGITFAGSDWSIPGNNAEPDFAQAAYDVTASVLVLNASDLSFTACTFTQIGGSALKLGPNVQNMTVTGCLFEDIGANAVTIDGLDCALDDPQVSRNIQITDNHICKYGQSFFNGVGVLLTRARDCVIANNEIHDGFYTAISAGWVWGYTYSVTDNVRIADNLIYDIGQGLLSDM